MELSPKSKSMTYMKFKILLMFLIFIIVHGKPCPTGELVGGPSECTQYSIGDHHCCYLSSITPKISICLKMSKRVYNGLKKLDFGGILYDIECGEDLEKNELVIPGSPCGVQNPFNKDDCNSFSNTKSSCCFFSYNGKKGCYNLGYNKSGQFSFGNIILDC
jgi:hypothetical protein